MTKPFNRIGIAGGGTMGVGIAQVALQAGYAVRLFDVQTSLLTEATTKIRSGLQKAVDKKKLTAAEKAQAESHLQTVSEMTWLSGCDLIIEAIPETMALKQELFTALDALLDYGNLDKNAVIVSNTSSLSITAMASMVQHPDRFAGLHFFNPVPLMKLIEIIRGQQTSDETVERLSTFTESIGKTSVIAKDTPGFIVNRVARPFYGEALKILGENGGLENLELAKTIDKVMTQAGGFKMGPFALMDLIGIDVNLAVTQSVYNASFQEPRYRPHPIQQKLVDAKRLGVKSGQGFYEYES